jgi:hypothetical protein
MKELLTCLDYFIKN